jgi:DNA polymerase I
MGRGKFLLIDGHAMSYRAHYALAGKLTNADGEPTETIFGFLKTIFKALSDHNPSHLCLVFDPVGGSFRNNLYSDYKANRSPAPPELKAQIEQLQTICSELNLPILRLKGYEADDVLASIVEHFYKDSDFIIYSGDKDLFSLLDKNVTLYRPARMGGDFNPVDTDWLKVKYNLSPNQITDFLSLMGDSADNIPGVKGIGEKTAIKLLSEFETMEQVYKNIDQLQPTSLVKKLKEGEDSAKLSRELVLLKNDVSFDLNIEKYSWPGSSSPELGSILLSKGFTSLEKDFNNLWGKQSTLEKQNNPEIGENRSMASNSESIERLLKELEKASIIAVDTETTSAKAMEAQLLGISFAYRIKKQLKSCYVPLNFLEPNQMLPEPYPDSKSSQNILNLFKDILESNSIKKIGQNLKYDILVFSNHGIMLKGVSFDTMLAAFLLNPNSRRNNLDNLSEDFLSHTTIKFSDLVGSGKKAIPLFQVPLEQLTDYACEDAEVTLLLWEKLFPLLKEKDLQELYEKIDLPLMRTLTEIEKAGVALDPKETKEILEEFKLELDSIEIKIHSLAKREFNINSTKELGILLFDELGIPSMKKTEKGARSTNAEALELIAHEHKIIPLILRQRLLTKLLSTYLLPLPNYINTRTNRIHTSLNQAVAATGRLASSDPNLQNIPIRGSEGQRIRKAFCAENGNKLLSLDYSQIELRVLAHYSNDEALISAYQNKQDIHDQAAYLLFNEKFNSETGKWNWENERTSNQSLTFDFNENTLNLMKKTNEFSDLRSKAKILNFSIVYGVTEFGLARNLKVSRKEAASLIELYYASFPGVLDYMSTSIELAREKGYAENYFGRKRQLVDINAKNKFVRQAAERLAMNTPIQSTAADLIKLVMIQIQKILLERNFKTKMILQIHDELLFEVPIDEQESIYPLIKSTMENTVQFKVPLEASGSFAKNWQQTK